MKDKFYTWSILFLLVGCTSKTIDYEEIKSYQDNSVTALCASADENTRVLLIFPHADDEITCVGLTSYLKSKGATIHLLTLGHHPDTKINDTRIEELKCSSRKLGVEKLEIAGLIINKWDDIMKDNITFCYDQQDSIKKIIEN